VGWSHGRSQGFVKGEGELTQPLNNQRNPLLWITKRLFTA